MTTITDTHDGDNLEISIEKAGTAGTIIRIESLDRNGTPNWGLTLSADDALQLADILEDAAATAAAADDKAADPFAGIVDVKHNDGWDAS